MQSSRLHREGAACSYTLSQHLVLHHHQFSLRPIVISGVLDEVSSYFTSIDGGPRHFHGAFPGESSAPIEQSRRTPQLAAQFLPRVHTHSILTARFGGHTKLTHCHGEEKRVKASTSGEAVLRSRSKKGAVFSWPVSLPRWELHEKVRKRSISLNNSLFLGPQKGHKHGTKGYWRFSLLNGKTKVMIH